MTFDILQYDLVLVSFELPFRNSSWQLTGQLATDLQQNKPTINTENCK